MDWFRRVLLWLDRPRHGDWRPTGDYRMRRWRNGRWEYRDMTEDEIRLEGDHRAW